MKKSKIIVAMLWIYAVVGGMVQGFMLPRFPLAQNLPFPIPVLIAMPLVIVIGAFFRSEIPGEFSIGKRIDLWFGPDTYRTFMQSLKLELMFSSMAFAIGIVGIVRTQQLGGPDGAFSLCAFFLSCGVAFLMAHFIGERRRVYQKPSPQDTPIGPYSTQDAAHFWTEVKKRRNLFFAVWLGWLIAGPLLFGLYSLILPDALEMTRGMAALATWGSIFFWSNFRVRQLRCYRCGKRALSSPMFFMKHAKCRCCGVTPQDQ